MALFHSAERNLHAQTQRVYGPLLTRKTRHQGSSRIALVTLVRAIIALTSTAIVWHGVY